jgi:hypothetical protein
MLKRIWCWLTLNHVDPGVRYERGCWRCKRCDAPLDKQTTTKLVYNKATRSIDQVQVERSRR